MRFVKVDFHFLLCSDSPKIRRRQHTQNSRQSIQFHRNCLVGVFSRSGLVASCDFERGLIKALSPLRYSVKCCHFHHTQAVWRFLSKIGCSGCYRSDEQFRWNVGSLTVLPLFPEETTKTLYAEFKKKIDNVEAETRAVYRHFKRVRLDTFQP